MPVEALRKPPPIPLTHVKSRPESSTPAPVPAQPILLTRRKSGRHKTLPFGPPDTPSPEVDEPAVKPRRR
jgi:hypothetical protein